MTSGPARARLVAAACLALDRDLAALRAAEMAKARTRGLIAALAAEPTDEVAPLTAARQFLTYEVWASARHRELNMLLARQMAEAETARKAAARSLARREVAMRIAGQS